MTYDELSLVWLCAAAVGTVAFSIAWLYGRRRVYRDEQRRMWMREHRPCWYCEGPDGARLRLEEMRRFALIGSPAEPRAPAPGDCDHCRWPPAELPKARVRR